MTVLSTEEAFVLDVLLEATQPVRSPQALIRSIAEQLIETRKELALTQKELAAFQSRLADKEMEALRLKLTSTLSEGSTSVDPKEDPYW